MMPTRAHGHTYDAMIGHDVWSEHVIEEGERFGQLLKQEARLRHGKRNKLVGNFYANLRCPRNYT